MGNYISRILVLCLATALWPMSATAQSKAVFSPLKDSTVVFIHDLTKIAGNKGAYIWYPGQLSAWLQQKQLQASQARCVNVGYPGKFNTLVSKTYFRNKHSKEVQVVNAPQGMAALWTEETIAHWESSLDSIHWNLVESDARYRKDKSFFDLLTTVWGDWLKQGNTRFPENFSYGSSWKKQHEFYNRPYGLSLCHGVNGAPPVILALNGIFGFSQDEHNLAHYYLSPNLLNLDYAKRRISIKEGFIEIDLKKQGMCSITLPDGIILTILDSDGKELKTVNQHQIFTFKYIQ